MSVFFKNIKIQNFKSIRSCLIPDCKRINLFIGKPNVGKSNILEALSLFSLPYLQGVKSRSIKTMIRVENEAGFFHQGNTAEPVIVETDLGMVTLDYKKEEGLSAYIQIADHNFKFRIEPDLTLRRFRALRDVIPVKRYIFSNQVEFASGHGRFLIPPYGLNLLDVIEQNGELKAEISSWFKEYGLRLVFDRAAQSLRIMQAGNINENIFLIPYHSIADTLQRMIFYKTAIASNHHSILIFEEPEAHSFPPYIAKITQEMIYRTDNQYFIATHSPFILNDLLENAMDDLSVYMVDYVKHATKVKLLSKKTMHEIYQNGIDLFTNSETFV